MGTIAARARVLLLVLAGVLWAATGCLPGPTAGEPDSGLPSPRPPGEEAPTAPLPVAVFLAREGNLEAVFRSLSVAPEEGPRAALEVLVAGPTTFESRRGYAAVLPPSTVVRSVTLTAEGVATADFSRELITRAGDVGGGSRSEALALHAIYLTLAQFPGVERVKVLIEGQSEGQIEGRSVRDFWGHVGLAEYLGGPVPVLKVAERQQVGDQGTAGEAGGLRLTAVRWWAHPSLFRLVFTLEGVGSPLRGVPPAEASFSHEGRSLLLTVPAVKEAAVVDLKAGEALEVNDWRAQSLAWERAVPCTFRLTLHPDHSYGWRLWGLTDPARIVLDVYAAGPAAR